MKLVVIGGVAGGASAACRVRRLDEKAEIVIFEKGEHVSFSNCSLPYYLGGVVESDEDLIMMYPEDFKYSHNIDVHTRHEVTAINRDRNTVTVKDLNTGKEFEEKYDKLVLAPGASPVLPQAIKGIEGSNVFTVRNVTDIRRLKAYLDKSGMDKVTVVGGGFIGIEVAENLKKAGKNVSLVESASQILMTYDDDTVQILHKEMDDNGIKLYLSSQVNEITTDYVVASNKNKEIKIPSDVVIMAIGVAPETALAVAAGLEIGETKGIKVDANFRTNDPDIYAVGDAIENFNSLTHKPGRLALAGPAQRQARACADHMYGITNKNRGFIGSSCIKVFDLNAACTGLSEKLAKAQGFNCDSVLIFPMDRVGIMPNANYMAFKLVFEIPTGKILGAQAIGTGEADKRIDVIASLITMGADLEDLKDLELCYAPLFSTAKDVVNFAALVATNILYGKYKQVHVSQVRPLVESGAYMLDVRNEGELKAGYVKGAHNIPLGQLRSRLDEIPKDVPVYILCRSTQRAYYAYRILKGNGFENIIGVSGSFLGISYFEYFSDKAEHREPIVSAYNFN